MKIYKMKVAANDSALISAVGNYVGVIAPSNATARIKTDKGLDVDLSQGQHVRNLERFESVRVYNDSNVELVIDVSVGFGEIVDNQLTGSVSQASNAGFTPLDLISIDGTVQTFPANTERARIDLVASPDNVGVVWVGGVANKGIPLTPGGVYQLPVSSEVKLLGSNVNDMVFALELM